jgi:predicted TIM-barrel enzyme
VPVLAASGTQAGNVAALLRRCAGAIVGTAIQNPGTGRVDHARAAAYVDAARA